LKEIKMEGIYLPLMYDFGIEGYTYKCPKCSHVNEFADCDEGCGKCGFSEPYVDPDDWYENEMSKPKEKRAWNIKTELEGD
jgi:hypothetical protein